ncbi:secretory lipase [Nocardia neocaledoniensis]|uniref:Secretory lipase n=2 Tax=Nocardia neocaledoniensis TaxID=236511 RepID=A0A317N6X0_9NOCA|nr:lipase family protein [Nocardia neocaledoniensis]PWV71056.1 secretory lipase [Nocardia neocaledoniensis]
MGNISWDRARSVGCRVVGCVATMATVVGVGVAWSTSAPMPASATPNTTDAFFDVPWDLESVEPGAILRWRPIEAVALQLVPMRVHAWQLLYRTTAADGSPYAAVTTVLAAGEAPPRAVLSYDSMIDAIAPECMPSTVLRGGAPWLSFDGQGGPVALSTTASESAMIAAGLRQGWAVSVPDLGGLRNNFLSPREPGFAALDGIRAVRNFTELGPIDANVPATLWGYSGGGIATAWAAEVQPWYAPEIPIAGMAIGAPVADFAAALRNGNNSPVSGLVAVGLAGLRQDSPELAAKLDGWLTDSGRAMMTQAALNCTPQNLLSFGFRDFGGDLGRSVDDLLADPLVAALLAERALGTAAPTAPLYIYNSVDDELSTIGSLDALVDRYCRSGTAVTYRRDTTPSTVSAHTFGWGTGAPAAFAWLTERVARQDRPAGCDTQTGPTIATPEALTALGEDFVGGVAAAIAGPR